VYAADRLIASLSAGEFPGVADAAKGDDGSVPVLARFLTRLLTVWLLGAVRRRTATAGGRATPPPWRTPGTGAPPRDPVDAAAGVRARALQLRRTLVETARIAAHALTLAILLSAAAVLTTAGTTATSLGPRWLGVSLLVLAGIALLVALRELRTVWHLRVAQRRRRHAEDLRRIGA
jgi:hypothetical protein